MLVKAHITPVLGACNGIVLYLVFGCNRKMFETGKDPSGKVT